MLQEEHPDLDLALTTNGSQLERLAAPLRAAGVKRINISVDSLDAARFNALTRGGDLAGVLRGVDAAQRAGFEEIKTNTVVLRDQNLSEVDAIAQWALERGLSPRFIELMPLGEGGALMDQHVPWQEVAGLLGTVLSEEAPQRQARRGPAQYVGTRDGRGKVGFITAVSNSFCDTCDRVRLTAKGEIRACLASPDGLSMRDLLRQGASDSELTLLLRAAVTGKTEHAFTSSTHGQAGAVVMTNMGG